MMWQFGGFFMEHFIDPIIHGTGYNLVNTLAFAFALVLALVLIDKAFEAKRIKLENRLWWHLIPMVVLGGALRALQDQSFFAFMGAFQYLFVTPMIYFTLFAVAMPLFLIGRKTGKNVLLGAGSMLACFFLMFTLIMGNNFQSFAFALGLTALAFSATYLIFRKKKFMTKINASAILAHALDACSSVTAITILGTFKEQHVLPNLIFSNVPFYWFIPLKIGLAMLAVYVIDKETKGNWNWLLKFTVLVLGMGPGIRNTLAILMSV